MLCTSQCLRFPFTTWSTKLNPSTLFIDALRKAIYNLKLLTHKGSKCVGVAQWAESKVILERSIMSLAGDGTARRGDVRPEVIDSNPAVVNTRICACG